MLVVGLTGGIASGKSTISNYLKSLGAVVIDADLLARQAVEPGEKAWQKIRDYFGVQALNEDRTLNRKKIAEIIFANPREREVLNKIIHPEVIKKTKELIDKYKLDEQIPLIVIDAPLLIEAGMQELVDEVWVINVEPELQIKRVMARDKISEEAAIKRLSSQMPTLEKLKYANRVINNNQNIEETLHQVKKIWQEVVEKKHVNKG
ncbi:MAG: dephospho-CoA kinase [Clostridia bacterium]|nr:dephospho-CoA kinase [Clostridia bacterium]MDN5323333.1 dephospho-CoA kinase [Clostridia bacterium]